jgi:hypothetical protein
MSKSDKPYRVRARKDITIRLDLYEWGESQIEEGTFWNWSHLVEQALLMLKGQVESPESAQKSKKE